MCNSITTNQAAIAALFRVISRYVGNYARSISRLSGPGGAQRRYLEGNPATGKKDVVWFAINDDRPLLAFAGLWTTFKGDRGPKSKPVPGSHLV
jgi:hypothetical protein